MATYNGGFYDYADRDDSGKRIFFRAESTATKVATVKSGQVLKARTLLESGTDGKLVAHSPIAESNLVTFAAIAGTKTVILAGLTFTSGASGASAADLTTAFAGLTVGMTAAQANAANPVSGGSFTAGTLAGYNVVKSSTANSVVFYGTTPNAGVTDLADTGNGSGTTIVNVPVSSPTKLVAGINVYDVDASGGDVEVAVYTEASFYAEGLVWSVNPATDTITLYDGTTKACTDYNTCATTNDLKNKLMEGSEFQELGFLTAGEVY